MAKTMTAKVYGDYLEKLDLTVVGAAPVLGISRRQSQRFESGENEVSKPVGKLLTIMVKHGITAAEVEAI